MLIRNRGLEIPVFPIETPVAWTGKDILTAAQSGEPSFVRRTVFEYHGCKEPQNLHAALKLANIALDKAAAATGIDHLRPKGGLYPGQYPWQPCDRNYNSSIYHLVPKGYSLVAQVDTIADAVGLDDNDPLKKRTKYVITRTKAIKRQTANSGRDLSR